MSESNASSAMIKRLEEEGEVGADYLEDLLDIVDLGGDIDIDIDHGRASIAVVAAEAGDERDLADLVGRDGEVLEAVQELTRLAVQTRTGNRSRLMLDIAGFRAERKEELQDITREAIARVRIEPLTQRMVHTLSDGERQKVMIAKALAQETPIIFLDEPTAFLDFPSKVEVMQLLHNLTHTLQKTVFMSTHDLELALQIADKIWLMDRTNGIAIGTPEDLSLEGKLSSFFSRKGITYDTETGFFRIDTDYRREIHLHGHGSRYAMVRKALQRNGIRADRHVADDSLHIDTTGSAGDPFVIHRADGSTQSATNIEALLSLIADQ